MTKKAIEEGDKQCYEGSLNKARKCLREAGCSEELYHRETRLKFDKVDVKGREKVSYAKSTTVVLLRQYLGKL